MTTPGALIAGRYRLQTRVASGGMGSVWEAEDEVLRRRVAVKLLLPQPGMSPTDAATARSRVIREARITARLHHPHAVTLYDVVEHAGQPCLIMQYVPSRSLNAILQEHGVLPEQVVARIGAEVASALAAAHLAGIVHRDVKPSNVLITPDGSAKLTDFGISHAAGDVNLTSTGMVSGTPAYLAPEVARGAQSGFPADVFSLGATLYAALEGAPPFGTELNPMAILHRVASGSVIPPRRSGSLTPLLQRMLAPVAADRPAMADVVQALAAPAAEPSTWSQRPTTSLPQPTVRDWPADPPAPSPSPPRTALPAASLADALLGGREAAEADDADGADSRARTSGARIPASADRTPATARRRRARLIGAALAVVLVGLVVLGIALLGSRDDGGGSGVAAATGSNGAPSPTPSSPAGSPSTSPPATSPPATSSPVTSSPATSRSPATSAGQLPPSSAATPSSSRSTPSSPATPTAPSPATRPSPSPSTRPSPSAAPTTSASPTTTAGSSRTNASTATPSSGRAGRPTSAELAAAVTDYYAGMPADTDDGWQHLTPRFRSEIAGNRESYQSFWDGISAVSVSNVRGSAPNTVEATVTYTFKDGRDRSVEDTRYQLVESDGILKIDTSEVLAGQ